MDIVKVYIYPSLLVLGDAYLLFLLILPHVYKK